MHRSIVSLAIFYLLASGVPAHAQSYVLSEIAGSNGTSYSVPAINDSGAVAFAASTSNGGIGIFSSQNGSLDTIVPTSAGWRYLGNPVINDSGMVAFAGATPADIGGIFSGNSTSLATIVSGLGPFAAGSAPSYGNPSIANNGTVVFVANNDGEFNAGPTASGIYSGNGGALTTIYSTNAFHVDPLDPAISKDGSNVVYADPGTSGNVYSLHAGTTTLLGNAGPFDPAYQVGVNNADTALITTGSGLSFATDIYTEVGTTVTPVAQAGATWFTFGGASLNDSGNLAFVGTLQGGVTTIYVTQGSTFDKIVSVGDPLDGSTISSLQLGPEGLNDSGQVAFLATLANGQSTLYTASVVPEPSTFVLLAVGSACCAIACAMLRNRQPA